MKSSPAALRLRTASVAALLLGALLLSTLPAAPARAQTLGIDIKDLTPAQVAALMEVARKVPCPCGCNDDSLLQCKINRPGCGTSTRMLQLAANLIRSGQDASSVIVALSGVAPPSPSPPSPSVRKAAAAGGGPVKVAVGKAPILGPAEADVTVIEYSDFQ